MNKYIFPCILMILDCGAGTMYLIGGDWKRFIYWIAACILTATVTF